MTAKRMFAEESSIGLQWDLVVDKLAHSCQKTNYTMLARQNLRLQYSD